MFYFERSYKVLNQINRLSAKIIYDTIKPFIETPPSERCIERNTEKDDKAANLFSMFTADIINANVQFTR